MQVSGVLFSRNTSNHLIYLKVLPKTVIYLFNFRDVWNEGGANGEKMFVKIVHIILESEETRLKETGQVAYPKHSATSNISVDIRLWVTDNSPWLLRCFDIFYIVDRNDGDIDSGCNWKITDYKLFGETILLLKKFRKTGKGIKGEA